MHVRSTLALASLILGMAPAAASATPRDVAATHAYIRADYALARAAQNDESTIQANALELIAKVNTQCHGAGTGGPHTEAAQPLRYEAAGALWAVFYGSEVTPIRTFLHTVKRLRWSNRKLMRAADSYASNLYALATLPMPNLCSDVQQWTASGFQTIPAGVGSFDRRVEAIEPHPVPTRLLAPYAQRGDKSVLAHIARLEVLLEETEFSVGLGDWESLLETLALYP